MKGESGNYGNIMMIYLLLFRIKYPDFESLRCINWH